MVLAEESGSSNSAFPIRTIQRPSLSLSGRAASFTLCRSTTQRATSFW
ncbi:MAG: hypothetical protein HY335_02610 [Deinococcus sp.]|nr:hypothetical protein [Deinococcus sp.]